MPVSFSPACGVVVLSSSYPTCAPTQGPASSRSLKRYSAMAPKARSEALQETSAALQAFETTVSRVAGAKRTYAPAESCFANRNWRSAWSGKAQVIRSPSFSPFSVSPNGFATPARAFRTMDPSACVASGAARSGQHEQRRAASACEPSGSARTAEDGDERTGRGAPREGQFAGGERGAPRNRRTRGRRAAGRARRGLPPERVAERLPLGYVPAPVSLLAAVFLGVLQAATEFLPVSSTAHLLVFGELLGHDLADPRFRAFATIIQSGTTLAVLVYFRAEIVALVTAGAALARPRAAARDAAVAPRLVHRARDPPRRGAREALRATGSRRSATGSSRARSSCSGSCSSPRSATPATCAPWRTSARADALLIGLGQALALVPGELALRHDDHGRHAARLHARGGGALQLPPLRADHPRRRRLQARGRPCRCCAASRRGRSPRSSGPAVSAVAGYLVIDWLLGWLRTRTTHVFVVWRIAAGVASRSSSGRACFRPATRRRRPTRRWPARPPRRARRWAPPSPMTLAALRTALAAHPWGVAPVSEIPPEHFPLGGFAARGGARAALRGRGGTHVLLTRRTRHLRRHAGQISFPGGRIDPEEEHLAAALREAQEEIGLDPAHADVLGRLSETLVLTSAFRLTPWVASVPYPYPYAAAPREVEEILHVPLSALLRARRAPGRARRGVRDDRGRALLHRRRRRDLGRDGAHPGGAARHLEDLCERSTP